MSAPYDPGQLTTDPVMQVRLLAGDTNTATPQLSDDEIGFLLANAANVTWAAAYAAETIAGKFASQVEVFVGSTRAFYQQKQQNYADVAERLRHRARLQSATPLFTGGSISAKRAAEEDTDRVPPDFRRDWGDVAPPPEGLTPQRVSGSES